MSSAGIPVAGYVNMNQLAHLALHHQGLGQSDKKGEQDEYCTTPDGSRETSDHQRCRAPSGGHYSATTRHMETGEYRSWFMLMHY